MSIEPTIDVDTAHAARTFMRRVEGRYPVREALLFGSRARHTHRADSDADIAVILKGPRTVSPGDRKAAALDMAGIAFDVLLETGILVEAPVGSGRWIYTGLGLWRQLPAGVDGAYRLLANLLSLGKK